MLDYSGVARDGSKNGKVKASILVVTNATSSAFYCGFHSKGERLGMLAIPGGKNEEGETNLQTALREFREEGGDLVMNLHEIYDLGTVYFDVYAISVFVHPSNCDSIVQNHPDALGDFTLRSVEDIVELKNKGVRTERSIDIAMQRVLHRAPV